ncbi:hypothetical protein [Shewanella dokdonensis]|uniref:Uncharacterized protein n=1 Tax=Shewanella dokdonensis TaxID=712036 RepID=A0ABX8DHM4_9GAMM|nr:hypothetical protein [Shewanella dokdonensis]MCL1074155.1 hypothetical protein [Shewanella dokdonensis]QVK23885.1 hypothetical protein KHX94_04260 [Shewanella dokdonensis]
MAGIKRGKFKDLGLAIHTNDTFNGDYLTKFGWRTQNDANWPGLSGKGDSVPFIGVVEVVLDSGESSFKHTNDLHWGADTTIVKWRPDLESLVKLNSKIKDVDTVPSSVGYFSFFGTVLAIVGVIISIIMFVSVFGISAQEISWASLIQSLLVLVSSLTWWSLVNVIVKCSQKLFSNT